jgi:hypothetical protein
MVVHIIYIEGIRIDEPENHSPVRANRHRPQSFQIAFQEVQAETWQAHVVHSTGRVKAGENVAQLHRMFRVHTGGSSCS